VSYRRYVATCVLLAASVASAQQATFTSANAVSFSISTDRNTYNSQEQITVRYQIKNVSKGLLYVPKREVETSCLPPGSALDDTIIHVNAWFENAAGKKFQSGTIVGCGGTGERPTFPEKMRKAAMLLRPGEHLDGTIALDGRIFRLPAGAYRIEATLDGWKEDQFSAEERTELSKMAAPFLRGEIPASTPVTVTR